MIPYGLLKKLNIMLRLSPTELAKLPILQNMLSDLSLEDDTDIDIENLGSELIGITPGTISRVTKEFLKWEHDFPISNDPEIARQERDVLDWLGVNTQEMKSTRELRYENEMLKLGASILIYGLHVHVNKSPPITEEQVRGVLMHYMATYSADSGYVLHPEGETLLQAWNDIITRRGVDTITRRA